jgi:hypothetical protein
VTWETVQEFSTDELTPLLYNLSLGRKKRERIVMGWDNIEPHENSLHRLIDVF